MESKSNVEEVALNKNGTVDNGQKVNHCTNIPLSNFFYCVRF
jgi:hypothetical protein